MPKRIKNPVMDRLREKRRKVQHLIDKINGHRDVPEFTLYNIITGPDWRAVSLHYEGYLNLAPHREVDFKASLAHHCRQLAKV